MSSDSSDLYLYSSCTIDEKQRYLEKCVPLYVGTLKDDWETVEKIINANPEVVYASITEGGETMLHVATLENNDEFVKKLIPKMKILGKMNKAGNTAFCSAAGLGNLQIIELMLDSNSTDRHLLPTLCNSPGGVKPICKAALSGHRDIVNRLYPSDFITWPIKERAAILTACIANGLLDIALKMINEDNKLLITEDAKKDTTLDVLVRMSFEFAHDDEKSNILYKNLLKSILSIWLHTNEIEISILLSKCPILVLEAARVGNLEFLLIILQQFPHQIWTKDNLNRNIFQLAVLNRHLGIFNLIYDVSSIRSTLAGQIDTEGNNMMHLAAKLPPQTELDMIPGAALQMQREILLFEAVTRLVPPLYKKMKNKNSETPHELFTKEHEILKDKSENWLNNTAKASMAVSTIIGAGVLSMISTVPGGIDNDTGIPIMSNDPIMELFYSSMVVAFASSLSSVQIFLFILTSRYAQEDFIYYLPLKLASGILTLIVALGAMVVAFCSSIYLSYHRRSPLILFLPGVFSLVPLFFVTLKMHLLRDVICSTYNARKLFGPRNRLFM